MMWSWWNQILTVALLIITNGRSSYCQSLAIHPGTNNEIIADSGNSVDIVCLLDSTQSHGIFHWSFIQNGRRHTIDNGVTINSSGTRSILTLPRVGQSDEGVYECTHDDVQGAAASVRLDVWVHAHYENVERVQNFTVGEEAAIECPAFLGDPPGRMIWVRYTHTLEFLSRNPHYVARNGSLTISNIQEGDAGVYGCNINRDVQGLITMNITVNVMPAMDNRSVIDKREPNRVFWYQDPLNLTCNVLSGEEPIAYTWTIDTEVETNQVEGQTLYRDPGSYVSGEYRCRAVNRHGSDTFTVFVKVNAPPKPSTYDHGTSTAKEGSDLVLRYEELTTPVKIEELDFEWSKQQANREFTPVVLGGRINETPLHKFLLISQVRESDEGVYQVNISNDFGANVQTMRVVVQPSDIDECALNIHGCDQTCTNTIGSYVCGCRRGYTLAADRHSCKEFLITAVPRPQTVAISSNQETQEHTVFTCTALGISLPTLTWNHNQITASNGSKYLITSTERRVEADGRYNVTSKLTIMSFNAEDSGFVTCRVENSQESESTQIAVLGKPDESKVEISMDGNVTLVIRFPSKIPAIMKLEVTFTDIEDNNPVQRNSTISESEYPNTALIRHRVDSSDVPQRFTVSVRVLVETEDGPIFGPEINFGGIEYTKIISSEPTVIISTSVVFSTLAVIIIVILFVFMGACLVHKHMEKKVDLNSQDTITKNSGNVYVDAFELNLTESRQQSVTTESTDNVENGFDPLPENPTTTEYKNGVSASVHADSLASLESNNTYPNDNASFHQSIGDLVIFTKQMLGSGAFGCVFKGKLKQQDCAVKVLNPLGMQFISSLPSTSVIQEEALERFTKECEFLQSLDHGNIVHHIDTRIHPESNLPLLVIELLDCTLKQYLYNCSEDLLPDHTQLSLSCDIASAMKFLHEHNIVHRDLCGDNILIKLTENNNNVPIAKVADFGMSRIIDCSTITHTLTALGHRIGYLPPEASLISQTRYDSGLDVFMFGVVMIQIVTKTPHVKSVEERLELIGQIADAHPLKDIILKCLHEESDKRPHMSETSKSLSTIYNQQRNQWIVSVL